MLKKTRTLGIRVINCSDDVIGIVILSEVLFFILALTAVKCSGTAHVTDTKQNVITAGEINDPLKLVKFVERTSHR